ncbi:MAG: sulfatase-like hydrolase/transferase, partial [bacterium]
RPMHPDVKTLPDWFSEAGFHTLYMNGMGMLEHNGVVGRFDESTKGPIPTLIDKIRRCNEQGKPVFAYYHTFDVHHPYQMSKYPPEKEYQQKAVDRANRLSEFFGDEREFTLEDAVEEVDHDDYRWNAHGQIPVWEYLNTVFEQYVKREKRVENPSRFLASDYVEGVNHFDQNHLNYLTEFLMDTDLGLNTTLLFTADHGESKRIIQPESGGEQRISFDHNRHPDQDLIRIPGFIVNARQSLESVKNWNLTSLVDVTPTLLSDFEIDFDSEKLSGYDLFKETPEKRYVYSQWSNTVSKDERTFPRLAFLIWQTVLDSNGFKYWRKGVRLDEDVFDLPLDKFVRKVLVNTQFRYMMDDDLENFVSSMEDTREVREQFLEEAFQQAPDWTPKLYRWDRDHFEENNLLDEEDETHLKLAQVMDARLEERFRDTLDIEDPEQEDMSQQEEEELTEGLKDLGYL